MRTHFRRSILISDISGVAALRVTIAIINTRIARASALTLAARYRFGASCMDCSVVAGLALTSPESRGNFVAVGRPINGAKGCRQTDGSEPYRRGNKTDRKSQE